MSHHGNRLMPWNSAGFQTRLTKKGLLADFKLVFNWRFNSVGFA